MLWLDRVRLMLYFRWKRWRYKCRGSRWIRPRNRASCGLILLLVPLLLTLTFVFVGSILDQVLEIENLERNTKLLDILETFPRQQDVEFSEYQLNVRLSNVIALDRDIPDTRPPGCDDVSDMTSLPSVSVVIPFYNEAWSMLLRCLHSVLARSPAELVREILLVDDHSDYPYLGEPLDRYTSVLSHKIRIFRNRQREGLIRARAQAARRASGDVLVFLDAHVECNEGWLTPLLDALRQNHSTVAIPHVDNLSPTSLEYRKWVTAARGSFSWTMEYVWGSLEDDPARPPAHNYRTATMIGCAFAVYRDYFWQLGGYDEGMYIWGGENLEMSFRVWMCGGSLVIVPCSRVGHVFRKYLPYSFPDKYGGRYIKFMNYQRVADVWLDDYQEYYYAAIQGEVFYQNKTLESLRERKRLRERLKCRSFDWYLRTLLPEVLVPTRRTLRAGQIRNLGGGSSCLSANPVGAYRDLPTTSCVRRSRDQMFSYIRDSDVITHGDAKKCLGAFDDTSVTLETCVDAASSQKWRSSEKRQLDPVLKAIHPEVTASSDYRQYSVTVNNVTRCLSHVTLDDREVLGLLECSLSDVTLKAHQLWAFTTEFDFDFADSVLDKRKQLDL